ncbi:1438_t:CDS:2, partial [Cetraspora pellucida]
REITLRKRNRRLRLKEQSYYKDSSTEEGFGLPYNTMSLTSHSGNMSPGNGYASQYDYRR